VSRVKLGFVCPSIVDNVFASTPLAMACVAKVCRRSWKDMFGRFSLFNISFAFL